MSAVSNQKFGSIRCPWGKKVVDLSEVDLTGEEKTWFVQEIKARRKTPKEMAEKYSLKFETVKSWVKKYSRQGFLMGKGGRRPVFDPELLKEAGTEMKKRSLNVRADDFAKMLENVAKMTNMHHGNDARAVSTPSRSTIARAEKALNVSKNADPTAPPTSRKRSREFFERVTLTIID